MATVESFAIQNSGAGGGVGGEEEEKGIEAPCSHMFFEIHVDKKIFYVFIFKREGEEKEEERERSIHVFHRLPLECPQPLGTWPATQPCAPPGNQTSDPLVLRLALSPLSHTSQVHLDDSDVSVSVIGLNDF